VIHPPTITFQATLRPATGGSPPASTAIGQATAADAEIMSTLNVDVQAMHASQRFFLRHGFAPYNELLLSLGTSQRQ